MAEYPNDRFKNARNIDAPAEGAQEITASDSADYGSDSGKTIYRGLYIGTSGNVKVITANGETVTFTNVPVGILPVRVTRVFSTGTTASGIVGLY